MYSVLKENNNSVRKRNVVSLLLMQDIVLNSTIKMEYENIEDFANGVAGSIKYKMGEAH